MLCKRTYKNQITLPKKVMEEFDGYEYFEARAEEGKIILVPVKIMPQGESILEKVREKASALGLTLKDIEDAVGWARNK